MYKNNPYEKTGFKSRIKELSILFLFIIISAAISLLVMNLCTFPIALFSINNRAIFTYLINHLIWIILLATLIYFLIRKIVFLKKNSVKFLQIIKDILFKPISLLATSIILFFLILIIVTFLYILLQNNYYLLYKLTNF